MVVFMGPLEKARLQMAATLESNMLSKPNCILFEVLTKLKGFAVHLPEISSGVGPIDLDVSEEGRPK